MGLVDVDLSTLALRAGDASLVEHLGRRALRFDEGVSNALVDGVRLLDGVIEADVAVTRQRSFHGLVWRAAGLDFESFFVRPHQVGNPDSIQYTPNPNGISSWQLYHGSGFWSPVTFPIDSWFTIRIAFAGARADIFVGDLATPVLAIGELKLPPQAGGIGIQVGGPGLHLARLACLTKRPTLVGVPDPEPPQPPGVISSWDVSDPFPEGALAGSLELPKEVMAARTWTSLGVERSGLANLGRINPLGGDRNTALARASIEAEEAAVRPLELGFSDRATLFLNGRALFHGDESYRNRDYRFLGSIGWWDTVYLPLDAGRNELVVAVSEDFGGWGLQARFADLAG